MAYDRYTWVDGEVITAQKLNHIEDGIEDGANGYECTETEIVYFDGSVVVTTQDDGEGHTWTEGSFTPELAIPTRDTLEIKLNGDQLELSKSYSSESVTVYSTYTPSYVAINVFADHATLTTVNEGTYTLSIKDVSRSATYDDCFKTAVEDICNNSTDTFVVEFSVQETSSNVYETRCDMTFDEIQNEMEEHGKFPMPVLNGVVGVYVGRDTAGIEGLTFCFAFYKPEFTAVTPHLTIEYCTISQFSTKYQKTEIPFTNNN